MALTWVHWTVIATFVVGFALCMGLVFGLAVPAMNTWDEKQCRIIDASQRSSGPCTNFRVQVGLGTADIRTISSSSSAYDDALKHFGLDHTGSCNNPDDVIGTTRNCWLNDNVDYTSTSHVCYQTDEPNWRNSYRARNDFGVGLGVGIGLGGAFMLPAFIFLIYKCRKKVLIETPLDLCGACARFPFTGAVILFVVLAVGTFFGFFFGLILEALDDVHSANCTVINVDVIRSSSSGNILLCKDFRFSFTSYSGELLSQRVDPEDVDPPFTEAECKSDSIEGKTRQCYYSVLSYSSSTSGSYSEYCATGDMPSSSDDLILDTLKIAPSQPPATEFSDPATKIILGAVFGSVLPVALLGVGAYFCFKARRRECNRGCCGRCQHTRSYGRMTGVQRGVLWCLCPPCMACAACRACMQERRTAREAIQREMATRGPAPSAPPAASPGSGGGGGGAVHGRMNVNPISAGIRALSGTALGKGHTKMEREPEPTNSSGGGGMDTSMLVSVIMSQVPGVTREQARRALLEADMDLVFAINRLRG